MTHNLRGYRMAAPLYYWHITLSKDSKAMMHVGVAKETEPMYQTLPWVLGFPT